jgi:tetratricopeptide (TPR) repeat protein
VHERSYPLSFFGWYVPHWLLAVVYQHVGRHDEATAAAQQACELSGRNAPTLGILGLAYGLAGRRGEAKALLEELTTQRRTTYVPPYAMAAVSRGLGEVAQALGWLEEGVDDRDMLVVTGLKAEPRYIPLRGHPRTTPAAENEPGALSGHLSPAARQGASPGCAR